MKVATKLSDEQLVKIIRSSDKELYAEIIERYQEKLMRYAGYIIGDENMAEDAVQDAFIKAYINLNGFNVKKKFSSWIYRIVHNEAMNMLSRQKKQIPMNEKIEHDSGVNLEDEFIKNELTSRAHHCLEQIPLIYKEPLSLFYLEEKSYEEIGDILRIPIGTVGVRISRAKSMMRKICKKHIK